jgi:hypothetical protein
MDLGELLNQPIDDKPGYFDTEIDRFQYNIDQSAL